MTFEEVFKFERNQEYSKEKVKEYMILQEASMALNIYNTDAGQWEGESHKQHIAKFGIDISKTNNECIEQIDTKQKSNYNSAFGNDYALDLVQSMQQDNKDFMDTIDEFTDGTQIAGLGCTVVGGILCFTPAAAVGAGLITLGNSLSIGGLAAENVVGYTEALTRQNINPEEIEELNNSLLMDASGFLIGAAAGKVGMKAFNKLIDVKLAEVFKTQIAQGNRMEALKQVFTNPEYLKNFMQAAGVKLSADFLISYAGDLAMSEALGTDDDWKSLLQSNLIGLAAGTSGDIKDVARIGIKGDRYRALKQKEEVSRLTAKEAEELATLRNDPDIKQAYHDDKTRTGVETSVTSTNNSDTNIPHHSKFVTKSFIKTDVYATLTKEKLSSELSKDEQLELKNKMEEVLSKLNDENSSLFMEYYSTWSKLFHTKGGYVKKINDVFWQTKILDDILTMSEKELADRINNTKILQTDENVKKGWAAVTIYNTINKGVDVNNLFSVAQKIKEQIGKDLNQDDLADLKDICNKPELMEKLNKYIENGCAKENFACTLDILKKVSEITDNDRLNYIEDLIKKRNEIGISLQTVSEIIDSDVELPLNILNKMVSIIGKENMDKITSIDVKLTYKFSGIIGINSLNQMPSDLRKRLLTVIVKNNSDLFNISPTLKKLFPILPSKQEEYCEFLPSLVKSLGFEHKPLSDLEINKFNHSMSSLSESLAEISDEDFSNIHITQEFTTHQFTIAVLKKVKALELTAEQMKQVYNHYGFDINLYKTKNGDKVIPNLQGYPSTQNKGNLSEITDLKVKNAIEAIKNDVEKFVNDNKIKCENPTIENLLNDIARVLPEIHSIVGKVQHKTHDFDVLQHSLKVMQKISQDPNFKNLSDPDKKIMMLASLLHDITKMQGKSDPTHAAQGSFDAVYITKKFNLTKSEELKLYTIIRNHEWLSDVNSDIDIKNSDSKSPLIIESQKQDVLTKKLQTLAFKLQDDNTFEMLLMFTHADLKAVKTDDSFHDNTQGKTRAIFDSNNKRIFDSRTVFDPKTKKIVIVEKEELGVKTSHGDAADIYAERIKGYIEELKATRPLTPTTKIPTMSEIRKNITQINSDGSTNLKGVWVDKDGLIVIKVNDVENWEAIGFEKGTSTKGITATAGNKEMNEKTQKRELITEDIETGNFKLIAHALDYPVQLIKFDAFGLPDSDALLSVTYMERPETKFRNFRTQGIGLDFDSNHIYGGGETDAGSGFGKSISDFVEHYILEEKKK